MSAQIRFKNWGIISSILPLRVFRQYDVRSLTAIKCDIRRVRIARACLVFPHVDNMSGESNDLSLLQLEK